MRTAMTNDDRELLKKLQIIQEEYDTSHGFQPGPLQKRAKAETEAQTNDRMNHLIQERDQLRDMVAHPGPDQDIHAMTVRLGDLDRRIQLEQAFRYPNARLA